MQNLIVARTDSWVFFCDRSHESRLAKLQGNIDDANATIQRSEEELKEAKAERLQIQVEAVAFRRQIELLRQQLAVL